MGLRIPASIVEVHMEMEAGQPVLVIKWETALGFQKEMSIPTYDLGDIAGIIGVPAADLLKNPQLLVGTAWIAEPDGDWVFDYDDEH